MVSSNNKSDVKQASSDVSEKTNQQMLAQCQTALAGCLIKHRFALARKLKQLSQDNKKQQDISKGLAQVIERIERSQQQVQAKMLPLDIQLAENLPVSERGEEIAKAISEHQVVVIAGETGSGKTTQIPKICLQLGLGQFGTIAHTQPRRLAARSVAQRIADELDVELGSTIGYQVRFKDQSSQQSRVKLMTDGILLAQTQQDKFLNQFDTIIIDEAHERSLNIDFLLGYLKQLLPRRPDLKVIITSATIDVERFSKHFAGAPIIQVSGRTFPVDVRYQPLFVSEAVQEGDDDSSLHVNDGVLLAVQELAEEDRKRQQLGDILVFLPGERDINECAEHLRKAQLNREISHCEILPLYARLSASEQNKIFSASNQRRIILSTNVAETSLTVPGIRYVIDTGTARISRYSYRSKVQRLPVEAISQASANQRSGRCGRVAEGICIRLYDESDYLSRPEFTEPEIQRTNLASVILQMSNLGLGEIENFPFVDAPDNRFIRDGINLLQELEAVDKQSRITKLGKSMARLPLEPRISRMIVEAEKRNVLADVMVVAAALSGADVKERPQDKQSQADQKHAEFRHLDSDFLTQLNIWHEYENQRQQLSNNQLRKWCKKHFISYLRMREWRDIYQQILQLCKDIGIDTRNVKSEYVARLNTSEQNQVELSDKQKQQAKGSYQQIHSSILAGLLSHIAFKQEGREYLGARNRKLQIFPGSALSKSKPKWLMAFELVETSQLFARVAAKIEPDWLMEIAQPLIKRQYFEAFWSKKRGQVLAYEQSSLYGLVINAKRIVDYSKIDLAASRELFIQQGLVEQQNELKLDFYKANLKLIEEVNNLEEKSRRRDFLVEDYVLADFYQQCIPNEVCSINDLTSWYKKSDKSVRSKLLLTKDFLLKRSSESVSEASYPAHITIGSLQLPLSYSFAPGTETDGVTMHVPAPALSQLPQAQLEWLVPGFIQEKCTAIIKGLPKAQRKLFVPVPDTVSEFMAHAQSQSEVISLYQLMASFLNRLSYSKAERTQLTPEQLRLVEIDRHFLFNIEVTDGSQPLGHGRHLDQLIEQFKDQAQGQIEERLDDGFERHEIKCWDMQELPAFIERELSGISIKMYTALYDEGDSVRLALLSDQQQALQISRQGQVRLMRISLAMLDKELRKELKQLDSSMVYFQDLSKQMSKEQVYNQLIDLAYRRVFIDQQDLPHDEKSFEQRLQLRGQLHPALLEMLAWWQKILPLRHKILKELKGKMNIQLAMAYSDVKAQLDELFSKNFIERHDWRYLNRYDKYLAGILYRLEKLGGQGPRDRANMIEWQALYEKFKQACDKLSYPFCQHSELANYHYLLQELRLSLFAQTIKTNEPVSLKKMKQLWLEIEQKL